MVSAALVALGLPRADPFVGLLITLVILKITWDSWRTIRGQTYVPGSADAGATLSVTVVGANSVNSASITSAPTERIG